MRNLQSWLLSCEALSHVMGLTQITENYPRDKTQLLSRFPLEYEALYLNSGWVKKKKFSYSLDAGLSIWDCSTDGLKLCLIYRFIGESEWWMPAILHDHSLVLSWLIQLKKCNRNNSRMEVWRVSTGWRCLILELPVSTSNIVISENLNLHTVSEVRRVIQILECSLV